jgi:hypothetical protein
MNATPTKPAGSERRTPDGKFLDYRGPGRPSKRILDLRARYKGKTTDEELRRLAADVERLELELVQADQEIADAERKFLESVSPAVHAREELALTLSRARICRYYLSDPSAFGGGELPADAALREYDEIRRELEEAQAALSDVRDPGFTRQEAIADADKWSALHAYETLRDRVDELLGAEMKARLKAEQAGHAVPPLGGFLATGDPFAQPRTRRNEMVNAI